MDVNKQWCVVLFCNFCPPRWRLWETLIPVRTFWMHKTLLTPVELVLWVSSGVGNHCRQERCQKRNESHFELQPMQGLDSGFNALVELNWIWTWGHRPRSLVEPNQIFFWPEVSLVCSLWTCSGNSDLEQELMSVVEATFQLNFTKKSKWALMGQPLHDQNLGVCVVVLCFYFAGFQAAEHTNERLETKYESRPALSFCVQPIVWLFCGLADKIGTCATLSFPLKIFVQLVRRIWRCRMFCVLYLAESKRGEMPRHCLSSEISTGGSFRSPLVAGNVDNTHNAVLIFLSLVVELKVWLSPRWGFAQSTGWNPSKNGEPVDTKVYFRALGVRFRLLLRRDLRTLSTFNHSARVWRRLRRKRPQCDALGKTV